MVELGNMIITYPLNLEVSQECINLVQIALELSGSRLVQINNEVSQECINLFQIALELSGSRLVQINNGGGRIENMVRNLFVCLN